MIFLRVLLTSSKSLEYPRISQLAASLESLGHEIEYLHIPLSSAFLPSAKLKKDLRSKNVDLVICGFFGQHSVGICKKNLSGVPVILDAFVSAYQTLVKDRRDKRFLLLAPLIKFYEKRMLDLSDSIITDTQFHLEYFVQRYGVPERKLSVLPVTSRFEGQSSSVRIPFEQRKKIHFHGEIQGFHGLELVLPSINSMGERSIMTSLYLGDKGKKWSKRHSKRINSGVDVFTSKVPYSTLKDSMQSSLVTLGIFRKSEKADLVIPNKVVESLSLGIPCITLSTVSTRNLLENMKFTENPLENGLILVEDPSEVEIAIRAIAENEEIWRQSSINAKRLFEQVFNSNNNGEKLHQLIQEVMGND